MSLGGAIRSINAAARRVEREAQRQQRLQKREMINDKKVLAQHLTVEAQSEIQKLNSLLIDALCPPNKIDWEHFKNHKLFPEPKPELEILEIIPVAPDRSIPRYNPKQNIFYIIFKSSWGRKLIAKSNLYKRDYERWEIKKSKIEEENQPKQKRNDENILKWEKKRYMYEVAQLAHNTKIDKLKQSYIDQDIDGVEFYFSYIMNCTEYPIDNLFDVEVLYNPKTRIFAVDYLLPSPEKIPTLKEVKYIQTRDEFKEFYLKEYDQKKLYDNVLYQIILKNIYEILNSDENDALDSVILNGWVDSINKSTGHRVKACIMSIQVTKAEFIKLNLELVEPKACFRKLKGISAAKLHGLTPVAPILKIKREDKRFASSYDVADELIEGENIAAMDWQDFEHLIRELFEREFATKGCEVKVTQASRDGGVDAVVFDPDPISGGKIVVQAKRYTNTVNVSAVRDLYGTVLNEGATKGILITTSDYGPDAYGFAKGKPLTLLSGSNLLHLMEKHGYKVRIDLKEAKLILKEKEGI